jgi:hypothetical protein
MLAFALSSMTGAAAALTNAAALPTHQVCANPAVPALRAPPRPAVLSDGRSGDYSRSGPVSMQMGPGGPFGNWPPQGNPAWRDAFARAQRRAQQNSNNPHQPSPPVADTNPFESFYQPPPQRGFGRPVEPYFDEPQGPMFGQPPPQGMPGFGPPPSFREPYASSSGMPGMGPPPGMRSYDKPPSVIPGLDEAWVLVYNVGRDNEGVYTHTQNGQPPSVLAFEDTYDANHFAKTLLAEGFDLATPICWDAEQLTSFSHQSGLEVNLVPRGEVPKPPSTFNWMGGTDKRDSDPDRRYPGDGKKPDAYTAYRLRLDALFPRKPDNCGDDDCILPDDDDSSPLVSPDMDASKPEGLLRKEAMTAIDAILTTYTSAMDLPTLMKKAWEKVKADEKMRRREEEPPTEEEEEEEGGKSE